MDHFQLETALTHLPTPATLRFSNYDFWGTNHNHDSDDP